MSTRENIRLIARAPLPYSDRYFNTDWQFVMFKEESQWG